MMRLRDAARRPGQSPFEAGALMALSVFIAECTAGGVHGKGDSPGAGGQGGSGPAGGQGNVGGGGGASGGDAGGVHMRCAIGNCASACP